MKKDLWRGNMKQGNKLFLSLISFALILMNVNPIQAATKEGKIWIFVLQSGLGVSTPTSFNTGESGTFGASMPLCSEKKGFPCIENFSVRKVGSQKWIPMYATKKVDAEKRCPFCNYMTWESIADKNLPAGADSYYWSASGYDQVTLSASVSGYFSGDPKSFGSSNGMTYQPAGLGIEILDTVRNAPDNEYQVHLKLDTFAKVISGWFIGRLTGPSLDLTSGGDLIVSGGSVLLQRAGREIEYKDLPPEYISDLVKQCVPLTKCSLESDPRSWNESTPWQSFGYSGNDEQTMKIFSQLESIFGNRAEEQYRVWAISNYRDWKNPDLNFGNCPASQGFTGLVSSNATVFSSDPPTVIDDGLSYQVGSPHLRADGSLNGGTYGVSLRKDLAKCLWGESFNPEHIGVELTYKDGKAEVFTTSLTSTENYYNLNTSGFHYSISNLTLKNFKSKVLSSSISPVISPSPTSKASQSAATKKTITCVKGKTTKKVTALSPKCPAGFKKK